MVDDDVLRKMADKICCAVKDVRQPTHRALEQATNATCEDIRESPALQIARLLEADGYDVIHRDLPIPVMSYENLAEAASDSCT